MLLFTVGELAMPAAALAKAPVVVPGSKKTLTPTQRYELGLKHMQRGWYTKALEEFNRVRNYHRDDPVSVKASLAIADVHFQKGDWDQARYAYEEFSSYYPRHPDIDYVVYRIGLSIDKRAPKIAGRDQSSTRGAVNVWTGFDTRFPNSIYKDDVAKNLARARNRLASKEYHIARFYQRRKAWVAVAGRAEGLVRRFPSTDWVDEGLVLMGIALHATGKVDEAKQVRERLSTEFPNQTLALARLDLALAGTPGTPKDEAVFRRPYRVSGLGAPTGGGMGGPPR
jgi:outer membrane protein assembly factor BamD